jgi:hypothetical protein
MSWEKQQKPEAGDWKANAAFKLVCERSLIENL